MFFTLEKLHLLYCILHHFRLHQIFVNLIMLNTVEPPNNGHIGSGTTVLCWEVVLISEVPIEMYFTPQMHDSMYCLPSDIILLHCNQSHMMLIKKLRCTEIVGDGCLFGGSQLQ